MICLECNNQEFVPKREAVVEQVFKGETLNVVTPALACARCGWVTLSLEQVDELRRRTADAYRKKHGLLTSDAIKAIRDAMGMTQLEFAKFLCVGEASVKRWETWLVQERNNDQLIRLKFEQYVRAQSGSQCAKVTYTSVHGKVKIQAVSTAAKPSDVKASLYEDAFTTSQLQSQMVYHGCNRYTASGTSPPETCGVVAVSLSAPLLNYLQEGFEKETADEISLTPMCC